MIRKSLFYFVLAHVVLMGSCRDESEDHLTLDQEIILIFGNGDTLLIDSKEVMDTVQTQVDTVILSITSSERYSLIVNGNPSLDTVFLRKGSNLILVRIGNDEYRINIFRLKSNESLLENILFPSLLSWQGLKNNVFEYSINVPREIDSVPLVVIKKDEFSKVNSYNNGEEFVDKAFLELGSNLIQIVCESEDGTIITKYIIEIFRQPLGQAELFELKVSKGVLNPHFDPQVDEYILNLDEEISLTVFATADSLAEITITYNGVEVTNEFDLKSGSSNVKIEVIADDGITKKAYNIEIFRKPWHFLGNGPFAPKDGISVLSFQNRLWLLGGWQITGTDSEVWVSQDGQNWNFVGNAPWGARHCAGAVVFNDRMWILSGDGLADVWSSGDGVNWTKELEDAPWGKRYAPYVVVFKGKIWLMGGESFYENTTHGFNDVWSSDDGVNWTLELQNAPWEPRGLIHGKVVFDGKIWLIGGYLRNQIWELNLE